MKLYKPLIVFLFLTSSVIYAQKTIEHTVSQGETFYSIAKKYQVKERSIYKLNKKTKKKPLQINQVLIIPYSKKYAKMVKNYEETQPKKTTTITQTHQVTKGETLYGISKNYTISVDELIQLNPEVASSLPIGYNLKLPKKNSAKSSVELIVPTKKTATLTNSTPTTSKTDILLETSQQYLGVKYRNGGTTKKGFDCSGLMLVTYKGIDMDLPRSSDDQAKVGKKISKSKAEKGNLIFFATGRKGQINHVGMITNVTGDEIQFIHASTSLGVIISSINEPYYAKRFVQINRVY